MFTQLLANLYKPSKEDNVVKTSGHKSSIATPARKFLGSLYHKGLHIMYLDLLRKPLPSSDEPPQTSQNLASFAASVRYITQFLPNLSEKLENMDQYISRHLAGKLTGPLTPS